MECKNKGQKSKLHKFLNESAKDAMSSRVTLNMKKQQTMLLHKPSRTYVLRYSIRGPLA